MATLTVGETRNIVNPGSMTFDERRKQLDRMDAEHQRAEERKKRSPYKDFIQLNNGHQKELRALAKENVNSFLILSFFMEHMNGLNAIMCSYQVIQEALNIKRTTASNAVKLLAERGFIYIKRSGRSNVYILNDDLVWKSWGKNTQYCEFPANVVLTMSEQSDTEKAKLKENRTPEVVIAPPEEGSEDAGSSEEDLPGQMSIEDILEP